MEGGYHGLHDSVLVSLKPKESEVGPADFPNYTAGGNGPEAADAGPIGLLRDGDIIVIDADKGALDVELSDAELAERKKSFKPKPPAFRTGALARFAKNVGPARHGAVTTPGADQEVRCYADI